MWWRREADAYESGLLPDGELRAARCERVVERADGSVALVLEDLVGLPATDWPLERFGPAARQLGRWQGSFRTMPDEPWLSRDWLRAYLDRRAGESAGEPLWARPRGAARRARPRAADALPPRLLAAQPLRRRRRHGRDRLGLRRDRRDRRGRGQPRSRLDLRRVPPAGADRRAPRPRVDGVPRAGCGTRAGRARSATRGSGSASARRSSTSGCGRGAWRRAGTRAAPRRPTRCWRSSTGSRTRRVG